MGCYCNGNFKESHPQLRYSLQSVNKTTLHLVIACQDMLSEYITVGSSRVLGSDSE